MVGARSGGLDDGPGRDAAEVDTLDDRDAAGHLDDEDPTDDGYDDELDDEDPTADADDDADGLVTDDTGLDTGLDDDVYDYDEDLDDPDLDDPELDDPDLDDPELDDRYVDEVDDDGYAGEHGEAAPWRPATTAAPAAPPATGPTIWAPGTAPGAWVPLGRPRFDQPHDHLLTSSAHVRTRRRNLSVFSLGGITDALLLAYGVTAAVLAAFTAALARRRGAIDNVRTAAERGDALRRSAT